MKEWHPERREVLDQHSDKEREGEEHWQTMWRYLKAFFLTHIMVTTCWIACTHTLIRAHSFMSLNHLRVCLVGRLVDWLSDRLLWLIVCLFFCLFICWLLVGCWCVGLLVCFFVRLFVCSFVRSCLCLFFFCMFVDVRPLMGRHLTFPPSAGRGGTHKQHQRYKPHASAAPEQRLSLQRGPCQFVCVDLFIGVFVRLMCWHCSRIYITCLHLSAQLYAGFLFVCVWVQLNAN